MNNMTISTLDSAIGKKSTGNKLMEQEVDKDNDIIIQKSSHSISSSSSSSSIGSSRSIRGDGNPNTKTNLHYSNKNNKSDEQPRVWRSGSVFAMCSDGQTISTLRPSQSSSNLMIATDESSDLKIELSVIIHRDENGFGVVLTGYSSFYVEHVHSNSAAWRAGLRRYDQLIKINGIPIRSLDFRDVILMFKVSCRFIILTILRVPPGDELDCFESKQLPIWSQNPKMLKKIKQLDCGAYEISGTSILKDFGELSMDDRMELLKKHQNRNWLSFSTKSNLRQGQKFSPNQGNFETKFHQTIGAKNQATNLKELRLFKGTNNGSYNDIIAAPKSSTGYNALLGAIGNREVGDSKRSQSVSMRIGSDAHNNNDDNDEDTGQCQFNSDDGSVWLAAGTFLKPSRSTSIGETYRANVKLVDSGDKKQPGGQDVCKKGTLEHELFQLRSLNLSQANSTPSSSHLNHPKSSYLTTHMSVSKNATPSESTSARILGSEQFSSPSQARMSQSASAYSLPVTAMGSIIGKSTIEHLNNHSERPASRRLEIIKELIETEGTHTQRLRWLHELFYLPLKYGGLMTPDELKQVFSCHWKLFKIHREIYAALLSADSNLYAEPLIGSALLEIFDGNLRKRLERASCSFCAAQAINADLLNKLTRPDTKTGSFMMHVSSQQMVGRLGIKDLLASCFQRLTKYPLLLESLLKATPEVPPSHLLENKMNANIVSDGTINDRLATVSTSAELNEHSNDEDTDALAARENNMRRMLTISLAEEREFIGQALNHSKQMLIKVNEFVKVAVSRERLREIWMRTEKYPGLPLVDITKQHILHEGLLTLRLGKRLFDVHVLLLNKYIIILTREGQDKYRLKFFTEGRSYSSQQNLYSPVFVIDEHLSIRNAATDDNGFYLLCKRKDDSRMYEFGSRSASERNQWNDRVQFAINRQVDPKDRRSSCGSILTKSSSGISAKQDQDEPGTISSAQADSLVEAADSKGETNERLSRDSAAPMEATANNSNSMPNSSSFPNQKSSFNESKNDNLNGANNNVNPTKIEGTISYVEDDEIVVPSKMEFSQPLVEHAIQVTIFDSAT